MNKTEVPGIYKVSEGILVNKDNDALQEYKARKRALRQKDSKINSLEEKVDSLTDQMNEITILLKKLTER